MSSTKIGFEIFKRQSGYGRDTQVVEIAFYEVEADGDSFSVWKNKVAETRSQAHTEDGDFYRLWYGTKISSARDLSNVDDVNKFANMARRIVRRVSGDGSGDISYKTPSQVVDAVSTFADELVYDRRTSGHRWMSDVRAERDRGEEVYRVVGAGGGTVDYVVAASETEARGKIITVLAERASGYGPDHRFVKDLVAFVSSDQQVVRSYEEAPDVRDIHERINEDMRFVGWNHEELDAWGNAVEVERTAVDEMVSAWDEEE